MTTQNKLLAGFAVLLLMFSVLLGHSMISLYRVASAQDDAADTARTLDLAGEIRAVIAEMSGAERELRISRLGNWPESRAEIRNSHMAMFQRGRTRRTTPVWPRPSASNSAFFLA